MDQVCSVIFLSLCNVPCQKRTRLTLKSYTSFFHLSFGKETQLISDFPNVKLKEIIKKEQCPKTQSAIQACGFEWYLVFSAFILLKSLINSKQMLKYLQYII